MPIAPSPQLFISSSAPVHLGGLVGYDAGTIAFRTSGPLYLGGSVTLTNTGANRGALFPAGDYSFDFTGNDYLYAIAPAGQLVTVEALSFFSDAEITPITLPTIHSAGEPVAVPGPWGESAWIVDADGNEWDLSTVFDEQYKQGIDGRFMPAFSHQIDTVPGQDGGRYRFTFATLGTLTLPLLLVGDSTEVLRRKELELARALNPKNGPLTLHVVTTDAVHRTIRCIYESGFQSDPATSGEEYETLVSLTFRQLDPYWSDAVPTQYDFKKKLQTTTFFPVSFPISIGPSAVFTKRTEVNEGDVEAWPIWTVTGPGVDFTLINSTTDEGMTISGEIPEGEVYIIDGVNWTVKDARGHDLFSLVDGDLWSLQRGENRIIIQLRNAGPDAGVSLSYYPKYLGV